MPKYLFYRLMYIVLILLSLCTYPAYLQAAALSPVRDGVHSTDIELPKSSSTSSHDSSKSLDSISSDNTSLDPVMTLSQLRQKYAETFKFKGPEIKEIAFTFDDVPDPRFTPQVLDILKKYKVKATFFVVGDRALKHPSLVRRMKEEGHVIGNHSFNHPFFKNKNLVYFKKQIRRTDRIIANLVGYRPKLIRPPYGEITEDQLKWAKQHGYKVVNWNVDSLDWKGLTKDEVKTNILTEVGPGSIILQHAGGGTGSNLSGTIEALPELIQILKKEGYTFVTLPQMLHISKENKKSS
ncbi:peptidoglycan/xylan/chitin deacetylase (PgdA/CDA1 family) [Paenibacillus shirakamiensis]|uniref:Peptidoglycan/xylan/chitin deacetylase (PgdA/CDA1 family) n=1 Tax=Paenibacillus shirakamiensis TaxID=1265935 RepID=A0ABS4JDN9_9BACL|nr:polysaccharide deacetylase family protein [Paenibacillus shirakamiensis]MBP1999839.1 peptidoglycan/xylan/chitin deacetylase (PgdA/CDA1 family) [Paenibacillus shirakamiensis]